VSAPIVRRSPAHLGTVVSAHSLTARMRRLVLRADSMRGVEIRPAQDVELLLRDGSGRRVKRRYTIRAARPEAGELDLDVLLHGAGPGSAWGAAVAPGEQVGFQGPRGKLQLRAAGWHLLIGDESALPAIASICEALPPSEPAVAVVEVEDEDDELPVRADTVWVHRRGALPGGPDLLAAALSDLALPDGAGHAYLLGETRAMVALRTLVEQRGIAHDAVFVKGYWNRGRPDRLTGRRPERPDPAAISRGSPRS
jgi:NADPH-dependent ferric siderophore reductase